VRVDRNSGKEVNSLVVVQAADEESGTFWDLVPGAEVCDFPAQLCQTVLPLAQLSR
jgi:hypothetical protein